MPRPGSPLAASLQERALGALLQLGREAGAEVTQQARFGNTGVLYFAAAAGHRVTVAYDFQQKGARIGVDPLPGPEDGARPTAQWWEELGHVRVQDWRCFHLVPGDSESLDRVIAYVRRQLGVPPVVTDATLLDRITDVIQEWDAGRVSSRGAVRTIEAIRGVLLERGR